MAETSSISQPVDKHALVFPALSVCIFATQRRMLEVWKKSRLMPLIAGREHFHIFHYNPTRKQSHSPDGGFAPGPLQGVGVPDELVQHVDDLSELGPVRPLPLPAVQHELVERHGAVHGRGQAVALIDSLDHLNGRLVQLRITLFPVKL